MDSRRVAASLRHPRRLPRYRNPNVLSQPHDVPFSCFPRPVRTRTTPRRMRTQAGGSDGAVLARLRAAVRPARRGAQPWPARRPVGDRWRRGQAAAGRGGQRPAAEEAGRDRGKGRPQARWAHPQAAEGRPGDRTAAARVRAAGAQRRTAGHQPRRGRGGYLLAQERRIGGQRNPPRARQLPGAAGERRGGAARDPHRLACRRPAAGRPQPRRRMRAARSHRHRRGGQGAADGPVGR